LTPDIWGRYSLDEFERRDNQEISPETKAWRREEIYWSELSRRNINPTIAINTIDLVKYELV
jgi:hypothetical protein